MVGAAAAGAAVWAEVMSSMKVGSVDATGRVVDRAARVVLLDGFDVWGPDGRLDLAPSAQRVVAFLAVARRPVRRSYVAGTLWLDTSEDRAAANLRSAVWRLRQADVDLVQTSGDQLGLAPSASVDFWDAIAQANRLLHNDRPLTDEDLDLSLLEQELLPDWYDDWVLAGREHLRQLRLHALERVCVRLTEQGRIADAVEAGLAAVAAEPLRESAQRCLIAAHLAEGNRSEAMRQFELYRRVLQDSLGIEPSHGLQQTLGVINLRDEENAPIGAEETIRQSL
jgi:DNA-binding SARP family transcriptional activator